MPTECIPDLFGFKPVAGRAVVAAFDGGLVTADAGALLLARTDDAIDLIGRFAACFDDARMPDLIEHSLRSMLMQRIFGIALGWEDLLDHDTLRRDPVLAACAGKLSARRADCEALAGKSTLNRLEHAPEQPGRYHRIGHDGAAIERLLVDLFLDAHAAPCEEIILDVDATDDPLHGHQEGRFFHGYYDGYCYLPLYIFCGRHLLAAQLRPANIDGAAGTVDELARIVAQIRACWPLVRIVLRGDSGFARDAIMTWCEQNRVDYLLGLARNARLIGHITAELAAAAAESAQTGTPARRFAAFGYATLKSWAQPRRVIAKAEQTGDKSNPRFVVTTLTGEARQLYEDVYCARGEMENRIKECQLDLFADRTSAATMRANQLRLWFASMAYVLVDSLRRIGLAGTELARATCGTIRVRLLKLGALVRISVRRVKVTMSSAAPCQRAWRAAYNALGA